MNGKTFSLLFFLLVCVVYFGYGFIVDNVIKNTETTKSVECFDNHNAVIEGLRCEETKSPYEIYLVFGALPFLLLLFAAVGLIFKYWIF